MSFVYWEVEFDEMLQLRLEGSGNCMQSIQEEWNWVGLDPKSHTECIFSSLSLEKYTGVSHR
jgi:hypothetical protein